MSDHLCYCVFFLVYSLGNNAYGQCGRTIVEGEVFAGSEVVNRVPFQHAVCQIVCGQDHTILRTEDGKLYSCGIGADGQTGKILWHRKRSLKISLA